MGARTSEGEACGRGRYAQPQAVGAAATRASEGRRLVPYAACAQEARLGKGNPLHRDGLSRGSLSQGIVTRHESPDLSVVCAQSGLMVRFGKRTQARFDPRLASQAHESACHPARSYSRRSQRRGNHSRGDKTGRRHSGTQRSVSRQRKNQEHNDRHEAEHRKPVR